MREETRYARELGMTLARKSDHHFDVDQYILKKECFSAALFGCRYGRCHTALAQHGFTPRNIAD